MKHTRNITLTLIFLFASIASFGIGPITGTLYLCQGTTTPLSDTAGGGTWSSSNPAIATVAPTGIVTGVTAGVVTISYTTGVTVTVSVTVNALPSSYLVTGSGAYCAGGAGLNIGLSGSSYGVSYQLFDTGSAIGAPVSGGGSPLSFGLHTAGSYSVVATNVTTACSTSMTGSALVSTNPLPTLYSISGGGNYCAGGTGVPVGLVNSQMAVSYQLYVGAAATGGAVSGTGAVINFGLQAIPGSYNVIATSVVTACSASMLGTANVSRSSLPTSYSVAGGGNYCSGGVGVPVALSGSSIGISYQLYNGSTPVGSPISGTGYSLNFGPQTAAGTYLVQATNDVTHCTSNMTGSAVVSVSSLPTVYRMTGGGGYCHGATGIAVGLANSDAGINYQLYLNGRATGAPSAGLGSALSFGLRDTAGIYTIVAENASTGCSSSMAGLDTVTVFPLPDSFTVTGGGGYCAGGSGIIIGLDGSQSGIRYQLLYGGVAAGSSITGTGAAVNFGPAATVGLYTAKATNMVTSCSTSMVGVATVAIDPLPTVFSVTGGGSYCAGGSGVAVGLSASNTGITYSLYNAGALAGVLPGTGMPLDFGLRTATGTYTVVATDLSTTCSSTMASAAVVASATPVVPSVSITSTPGDTVCAGTTVTFVATGVNGGSSPSYTWTLNGVPAATSSTYSYLVADSDDIRVYMSSSAACASPTMVVSDRVIIHTVSVPAITGAATACVTGMEALSDTLAGGVWSSSNPGVATISTIGGSTGVVNGIAAGTAVISYTISGLGCYAVKTITIDALPSVTASASAALCGGTHDLTASGAASYFWLPLSGLACASCAVVTVNPMATTVYTVTGTDASGCSSTATVPVNGNRISGFISYSGTSADIFRVWLIQFNASDSSLIAIDSTETCMDSGMPYYEFDSAPAGSYMVKAKLLGAVPGSTGYIPTYSLSTPYWYAAAGTPHTTGTDTLHINMVYGIVPAGPGFIGGLISAGAGRGTSSDIAAPGMLVYLVDAVSNFVVTYTYTDEAGAYSFSNIAPGNYRIYPEAFSFTTIPSATIMLSTTADTATGVNFRQFIDSRVIRQMTPSGVIDVNANGPNVYKFSVYPNPANNDLNVLWGWDDAGIARIMLTDMRGVNVYATTINIDDLKYRSMYSAPVSKLDIGAIGGGVYLMTVKGDHVNYSTKVVVE